MRHLSHPTKVFVLIIILTLVVTYAALSLAKYQKNLVKENTNPSPTLSQTDGQQKSTGIDTSAWQEYRDPAYPLAFRYPEDWEIDSSTETPNYYSVVLNPANSSSNIHIYVSTYSYLAFEGLKQTPYKRGKISGISVDDSLIGVKMGEYFYTFDATMNPKQLPEFQAMLETVKFE